MQHAQTYEFDAEVALGAELQDRVDGEPGARDTILITVAQDAMQKVIVEALQVTLILCTHCQGSVSLVFRFLRCRRAVLSKSKSFTS